MKKHQAYLPQVVALWLMFAVNWAGGAESTVSPDAGWQLLKEGNQRYISGTSKHPNQSGARREEVAKGQKPFAIILACSDSRVSPEVIFDQGLGDVFVIRVAGNVIDNAGLGSMEYAVEHLGASLIVVLGHERCGAVAAAVSGGHSEGHVHSIVSALLPAVKNAKSQPGDPVDNTVRSNVQMVANQISQAGPLINEKVKAGKVKVIGARYDLDTGAVEILP